MFETDEYVAKAPRAGTSGFLGKYVTTDALVATPERLQDLTPREREVTALATESKSNAEIAEAFVLSLLTVRTHIQRAITKLGARDRAQLSQARHTTADISAGHSLAQRKLLKRVSQVRILPGAPATRPRTDHGPGPFASVSA
ncbi:response regulator transcription factor [Streptomyces chartreusis]|uniref:response regulator transcription factor n=1 Tax=Streptomyces chartreusis TaxID=1969 RepID=UPI00386B5E6C